MSMYLLILCGHSKTAGLDLKYVVDKVLIYICKCYR